MRLLGRVYGEKKAFTFHAFLQREGIDGTFEPASEEGEFNIWIEHEDEVERAQHWLNEYQKDPEDPRFSIEAHPIDQEGIARDFDKKPFLHPAMFRRLQKRPARAPFTRLMIFICIFVYFWNSYQQQEFVRERSGAVFYNLTPLFLKLCYDVPPTFSLYMEFFKNHPVDSVKDFEKLTKESTEFQKIEFIPYWNGLYDVILKWPKANKDLEAPMFIKLREGEIWRLFTPVLMHGGLLHILFNMLWLWLLGKQLEERLKLWQYLVITLVIAVVSNTAQYLMSGPLFLGYSGVITGLAGFIWMRQCLAPWEGYPLNRSTLIFLMVFIIGMVVLQVISFFLIRTGSANFPMNIANTAHISGAVTGAILGRIPFLFRGKL